MAIGVAVKAAGFCDASLPSGRKPVPLYTERRLAPESPLARIRLARSHSSRSASDPRGGRCSDGRLVPAMKPKPWASSNEVLPRASTSCCLNPPGQISTENGHVGTIDGVWQLQTKPMKRPARSTPLQSKIEVTASMRSVGDVSCAGLLPSSTVRCRDEVERASGSGQVQQEDRVPHIIRLALDRKHRQPGQRSDRKCRKRDAPQQRNEYFSRGRARMAPSTERSIRSGAGQSAPIAGDVKRVDNR